jgi:hypothetical protein
VSVILYHGSGAGDFSLENVTADNGLSPYRHNVSDLLRARGQLRALELFKRFPWESTPASSRGGSSGGLIFFAVGEHYVSLWVDSAQGSLH